MHGASETVQEHQKKIVDLAWFGRTCGDTLFVLRFKGFRYLALGKDTPKTKVTQTIFLECCLHFGTHTRSDFSRVGIIRKGQVHELLKNVAQDGKAVDVRVQSRPK